jgi:hypothetical protein
VTCGPTFAGHIGDLLLVVGLVTLVAVQLSVGLQILWGDFVFRRALHFLLRMVRIKEMLYSPWFSATIKKVLEDQ